MKPTEGRRRIVIEEIQPSSRRRPLSRQARPWRPQSPSPPPSSAMATIMSPRACSIATPRERRWAPSPLPSSPTISGPRPSPPLPDDPQARPLALHHRSLGRPLRHLDPRPAKRLAAQDRTPRHKTSLSPCASARLTSTPQPIPRQWRQTPRTQQQPPRSPRPRRPERSHLRVPITPRPHRPRREVS